MALTPLATVQDLSNWLGEPITEAEDQRRAESVIRGASVLVRAFTKKDWLVDSDLDPNLPEGVSVVATQVAARGYANPDGWANESVDDWRGGGRVVDEAGLFLTASEKATLSALLPAQTSGLGVIGTTRMPSRGVNAGYVPADGNTLIPWY